MTIKALEKAATLDSLERIMYRKAFEEDSDMQKWDGGCWIRYKMFEDAIEEVRMAELQKIEDNNPVLRKVDEACEIMQQFIFSIEKEYVAEVDRDAYMAILSAGITFETAILNYLEILRKENAFTSN